MKYHPVPTDNDTAQITLVIYSDYGDTIAPTIAIHPDLDDGDATDLRVVTWARICDEMRVRHPQLGGGHDSQIKFDYQNADEFEVAVTVPVTAVWETLQRYNAHDDVRAHCYDPVYDRWVSERVKSKLDLIDPELNSLYVSGPVDGYNGLDVMDRLQTRFGSELERAGLTDEEEHWFLEDLV